MTLVYYFALGASIFSLAVIFSLLALPRHSRIAADRVRRIGRLRESGPLSETLGQVTKAFLERHIHSLRVRFGLAESASLRERMQRAGYRGGLAEDLYIAGRTLGPVLGFLLGSLIESNRGFWMLSLPAVTYLLPDMVLQHRIRSRRNKIRCSMPDAIDLLVICVDAGLGIDQALLRVTQELDLSHPEIAAEFLQINREQQAGKPRMKAWQDLDKRVYLEDLSAFVNMLMQTERFGTPISRALSNFADALRVKRRQRAEEMAAKTTVKIVFPLVLFIFPSMFIVLLGPALLMMMRGLEGISH